MESSRPYLAEFFTFDDYFGLLADDPEGTRVYGFEVQSEENRHRIGSLFALPDDGACFGYVHSGSVGIRFGSDGLGQPITLFGGTWFTTKRGWAGMFMERARVAVFQRVGHVGVDSLGVLSRGGDLGYIDGCRDSVLSGPRVMGMPVLNALFVPPGVHQTMHTHPSTRAGIVVQGEGGLCETPESMHSLRSGTIFYLPTGGRHKFRTDIVAESRIDLVAYHPDSDFGPTDEQHPMLNRTLVDGISAASPELAHIRTKS